VGSGDIATTRLLVYLARWELPFLSYAGVSISLLPGFGAGTGYRMVHSRPAGGIIVSRSGIAFPYDEGFNHYATLTRDLEHVALWHFRTECYLKPL